MAEIFSSLHMICSRLPDTKLIFEMWDNRWSSAMTSASIDDLYNNLMRRAIQWYSVVGDTRIEKSKTRTAHVITSGAPAPASDKKKGHCFGWMKSGKCEKKDCPYQHLPEKKGSKAKPAANTTTSKPQGKANNAQRADKKDRFNVACRNFAQENCKYGSVRSVIILTWY